MGRLRTSLVLSLVVAGLYLVTEHAAGLRAMYFLDQSFSQPAARTTSNVDTESLLYDAPVRLDMPFSVEWSGYVRIRSRARYVFAVDAAGPAAILIDGRKVVGDLNVGVGVGNPGDIDLDPGQHAIVVRYVHGSGLPAIGLRMGKLDEPLASLPDVELSPQRRAPILYDVAGIVRLAAVTAAAAWAFALGFWLVKRVPPTSLAVVGATTAIFVAGVAYNRPIWLRGPRPYPYEWQWAYQEPSTLHGVGAAVVAAMCLLGIIAYLGLGRRPRSPRARAIVGLGASIVAASAFQIALLANDPDGAAAVLANHTLSADFNSYFDVAVHMPAGVGPFLAGYRDTLPNLERHAATHPPGPILYYRAVLGALERAPRVTAVVASLLQWADVRTRRIDTNDSLLLAASLLGGLGVALSAAATVLPVAAIAESAGADPLTAAQAGALWAFCPSAVLFSAQFDQVVTLLVASTCALGCAAVVSERSSWSAAGGVAAGLAAGLAVFCSFGAVPMLGAAAIVCLVVAAARNRPRRAVVRVAAFAVVGALAVSAAPVLAGYDPVGTARLALSLHRRTYTLSRGRFLWMRFNLLDFAIFLGVPLLALRAARLVSRDRQSSRTGRWLLWAMALFVAALDLADVTRGEVGRLWMPMMPMAFLAALPADDGPESPRSLAERVLVGGCLALVCVFLRLYWNPG